MCDLTSWFINPRISKLYQFLLFKRKKINMISSNWENQLESNAVYECSLGCFLLRNNIFVTTYSLYLKKKKRQYTYSLLGYLFFFLNKESISIGNKASFFFKKKNFTDESMHASEKDLQINQGCDAHCEANQGRMRPFPWWEKASGCAMDNVKIWIKQLARILNKLSYTEMFCSATWQPTATIEKKRMYGGNCGCQSRGVAPPMLA